MRRALDSYIIRGVTHNINFLRYRSLLSLSLSLPLVLTTHTRAACRSLTDHPRFISGDISTKFIPEEYPEGYKVCLSVVYADSVHNLVSSIERTDVFLLLILVDGVSMS